MDTMATFNLISKLKINGREYVLNYSCITFMINDIGFGEFVQANRPKMYFNICVYFLIQWNFKHGQNAYTYEYIC